MVYCDMLELRLGHGDVFFLESEKGADNRGREGGDPVPGPARRGGGLGRADSVR